MAHRPGAGAPQSFLELDASAGSILARLVSRHGPGRVVRRVTDAYTLLHVTLANPTRNVAVMAHVQLRNQRTNRRVLPVIYSENYVSLIPEESRTITIEAASANLAGTRPMVVVDGWNVAVKARDFPANGGARIATNDSARVVRSPAIW